MTTWSAAILVGGRGRRLGGRVKPLVAIGGRTILDRQRDVLAALGVVPTLVTPDPAPFATLGVRVVLDAHAGGALAGLYTALTDAAAPHVLVLAGDLPFVTAPFLTTLLERRRGVDAVVPRRGDRWHPLCAVYDRGVANRIRERLDSGRWRVRDLLDELRVVEVADGDLQRLDPVGRLLLNVNTPADLAQAERLATLEE